MKEQGYTLHQIGQDDFYIDETVDARIDTTDLSTIARSTGYMGEIFSDVLRKLLPDYLVVLGDPYELLLICSTVYMDLHDKENVEQQLDSKYRRK